MSLRDVITALIRGTNATVTPTTVAPVSTTTKPHSTTERTTPSTSLYKVSDTEYVVVSNKLPLPAQFTNIDNACDFLMDIRVLDDQIDLALVNMSVKGTTRANFDLTGMFVFSDEAKFTI